MSPVCPYCGVEVTSDFRYCSTCGTAHHEECWDDNGGCTVFGCSSAPPDEPKLNVVVADAPSRTFIPHATPPAPPPVSVTPPPPPPAFRSAPPPLPSFAGYYVPPPQSSPLPAFYPVPPKSRTAYIVLGIFLGAFGGHNFFAGYTGRAIAQLCITVCSVFTLSIVSAIWAIVEICTVDRDSKGVPMV